MIQVPKISLDKVSWDSVIAGIACLVYAVIPEPFDVLPVLGWLDEGAAVVAGIKLIIDGLNGVSLSDSIKKTIGLR